MRVCFEKMMVSALKRTAFNFEVTRQSAYDRPSFEYSDLVAFLGESIGSYETRIACANNNNMSILAHVYK